MNPALDPILLFLAKIGGRPGAVTVMRCVTGAPSDPTTRLGSRRGYGRIEVLSAFSCFLLPGSRLGSQGLPIRTQPIVVVLGCLSSTTRKKEVKARGADLKQSPITLLQGSSQDPMRKRKELTVTGKRLALGARSTM
ncbi:hypothetical protein JMJ77_0014575 [Colletotrichum scovillei]|uniref:Uncharacterized protein n=1 Tax=Colletotrichum scovillei TaxID=1209932 RepID=A0A9P7R3S3_9PEZI|nr:hypothetical protein JMJ77_0014575 [Colletotrichum scovillei]KAG7066110.1 hypothetical protein JMJ78_0012847 [Colletotrichum scovillei]KAG7068712.1 hypothetical protein JMJ76_0008392 [Colletotrichum scovillei]